MKVFIDASAYLSILMENDSNHQKASGILKAIINEELVTSYAVLGEVLTVSSQRYDRQKGIKFVKDVINSSTMVILEDSNLISKSIRIFQEIKTKNTGWVDCYSFAIVEEYGIEKIFSFDHDFKQCLKAKILE